MLSKNFEKIIKMLEMETLKARETKDLSHIEETYFEIQRFIKTEFKKLEEARTNLYLEALDGQEEAQINNWLVSYKPLERFALDTTKVRNHFGQMSEEEFKNTFYTHTITKPSLKFKTV